MYYNDSEQLSLLKEKGLSLFSVQDSLTIFSKLTLKQMRERNSCKSTLYTLVGTFLLEIRYLEQQSREIAAAQKRCEK